MIIDFQNVSYSIPNGQPIYKNLTLKVFKNDYFGILGKNGAGKSTLIEMIMGMRKLDAGKIFVFGEDPNDSTRLQKNRIFIVTHDMLIPSHIAVKDMLKFYQYFYPKYDLETESYLLNLFEIDRNKKFGALSTGQKIKAMLIAAFSAKAELYLFDEVTAVLDPKSRRNFFKYLNKFREEHECALLLATNIAEDLHNSVQKVIFIDDHHKVKVRPIELLDELFDEGDQVA